MSLELTPEKLTKAVALFYDGEQAPIVSAKGEGAQAEEIIKIANENGIPLCDSEGLVELLTQLELGDNIPRSLYITIAHIIAFAYKLQLDNL